MTRPSVDLPQPDSPTRPSDLAARRSRARRRRRACTVRVSIALPSDAAIFSPSERRGANCFETSCTSTSALMASFGRAADDGSARRARRGARSRGIAQARRRSARAQRGRNAQPSGSRSERRRGARDLRQVAARLGARGQRFKQPAGVGMARAAQHRGGRPLLDDAARIHHEDAARERGDGREIVADPDQRRAESRTRPRISVEDLRLDRDVERGRRLVADDQRRPVQQRDRDGDALAHAAGELVRIGIEPLRGVRNADRGRAPRSSAARAASRRDALVRLQRQAHLRRDGEHRIEHRSSGPGTPSRCAGRAARAARPARGRPAPGRRA